MAHVYDISLYEAVAMMRGGRTVAQYDPSMQCEVWMRRNGNRFEVSYGAGCRWTQGVCLFVHSSFRVVSRRDEEAVEFDDSIPLTVSPATHQPKKTNQNKKMENNDENKMEYYASEARCIYLRHSFSADMDYGEYHEDAYTEFLNLPIEERDRWMGVARHLRYLLMLDGLNGPVVD